MWCDMDFNMLRALIFEEESCGEHIHVCVCVCVCERERERERERQRERGWRGIGS